MNIYVFQAGIHAVMGNVFLGSFEWHFNDW
jgi:hypothetical protein